MKPEAQSAVLLVSDLPVWGRVALAAAVPIVESAGFQACCLPTSLLSTHGAFPGFILEPQSAFLRKSWAHLGTLELKFAGVALGLVGELSQFDLLTTIVQSVRQSGGLVFCDPILGDNGRRYGMISQDFVPAYRTLLAHAQVVTPNLTEAALLLGENPETVFKTNFEVLDWARALSKLGPAKVVITSAPFSGHPELTGVVWYDAQTQESGSIAHRRRPQGYPGTGDVLSARLLVSLLRGTPFPRAIKRSVASTVDDVKRTERTRRPVLWGLEGPLLP